MNYKQLIEKALGDRSVNQAAEVWGVPQSTLDRYVKGKSIPDYQTAKILARESGISQSIVMDILAEEEAKKKPRGLFQMDLKLQTGFVQTPLLGALSLVSSLVTVCIM